MLETWNLKEGHKSQKQTIKKIIKYPGLCALELPSFKSPFVLLSPQLHDAPLSASRPLGPGCCGGVRQLLTQAWCSFCRFRAEHWFRLRGAHWADLLPLWHSRWPGPWGRGPCACCHVLHGGDSGGAAVCWPLEEVPWHWNWDDHHQSRQVRTSSFEWPPSKDRGQSWSCYTASFRLVVVGSISEAKDRCICISYTWTAWQRDLGLSVILPFFLQGPLEPQSLPLSQAFSVHKCTSVNTGGLWCATAKPISRASVAGPSNLFNRKSLFPSNRLHLLRHLKQPDTFVRILFLIRIGLGLSSVPRSLVHCFLSWAWDYYKALMATWWKLLQSYLCSIIKVFKTQFLLK